MICCWKFSSYNPESEAEGNLIHNDPLFKSKCKNFGLSAPSASIDNAINFYIPIKKIVIETDGKYHDNQLEYDKYRTNAIIRQYPNVKVIRWGYKDFCSPQRMKELLKSIA